MSTDEQQIPSTSTTKEIQYEQYEIENDDSDRVHQNLQEVQQEDMQVETQKEDMQEVEAREEEDMQEEAQQEKVYDYVQQPIASSSTAESSNHTLRDDNLEQHNPAMQLLNRRGIPITYSKLSDRYTFSFSADLISQFDKYRAHMRESIRQELDKIYAESDKNKEEIFSIHQVHHGPAASVHSNSQETSTRNRSTDDAPKSCLPTKSSNKHNGGKSFRISFLRGKTSKNQNQNQNRNATTITTTTATLSDLDTLSSDVERQRRTESDFAINQRRHKSRLTFIKKLPFVSSCA
ncbi:2982_t:CDS:2, partial [Funneliformis mosseae]